MQRRRGISVLRNLAVNSGLRILTIASRSLLLFYMARYLGPEPLGEYGLLSATVAYSVLVFGLEYHFYATRQILAQPDGLGQVTCMRNQLSLHAMLTPLLAPLLLVIFFQHMLPWSLVGWFYAILLLDHVAQELMRFMMTLQRPQTANFMYFLRNAWIYAVVGAGVFHPAARQLSYVWIGWIAGSLLCIALAIYNFRHLPWRTALRARFDRVWATAGLRTCWRFFLATLAITSLTVADRYAIEIFGNTAQVGIYTFYAAIGGAIQSLVHANVGLALYPKAIHAFQRRDFAAYRAHVRHMAFLAPAMAFGLALVASVLIYPVLYLVHRPIYGQYLPVLWITLAGAIVNEAAEAPHLAVYVRHHDKVLTATDIAAAFIGLAALFALVPRFGIYGAAMGVLLGAFSSLLARLALLWYVRLRPLSAPMA